MKKMLVPLLVLVLLCMSMTALAEGGDTITLELNTAKLPVYAAGDPSLNGLTEQTDPPVLVMPVKKAFQLQVKVQPQTVKNKKVTLSVDNDQVAKAAGNTVTAKAPGETVLTIASAQDPSVAIQYRIVVIQPITRITVTASEKSVPVGGTISLTPVFVPENATRKLVTWTATTGQLLSVDENGTVTGLKKGAGRVTVTAADGSNVRASININVTQGAEELTLDKPELTVDVNKTAMLKPTVLPRDTNNKKVAWSSSDESIAKVNAQGRIQGVSVGECEITCTSQDNSNVQAKATVHVQQPVRKVTFGHAPNIYVGETAQLTWMVEPENASNPALKLTSTKPKILEVSDDGTVIGVGAGDVIVNAVTTDGSNRRAQLRLRVMQHVTGAHFKRHTAYIDLHATSEAGIIIEPEKFTNQNIASWESGDPSIASVAQHPKKPRFVNITGNSKGTTTVTGTTEDGGFQASITVKVGDWADSLRWVEAFRDGKGRFQGRVKNVSNELNITSVKVKVKCYDDDGNPAPVNTKDGSNEVYAIYNRPIGPGATSAKASENGNWKYVNWDPDCNYFSFDAWIVEFTIDNDWVKVIPKNRQRKISN